MSGKDHVDFMKPWHVLKSKTVLRHFQPALGAWKCVHLRDYHQLCIIAVGFFAVWIILQFCCCFAVYVIAASFFFLSLFLKIKSYSSKIKLVLFLFSNVCPNHFFFKLKNVWSDDSFNFPLGWIKYIIVIVKHSFEPFMCLDIVVEH